jgi:predicted hotdog family 3-hydroxylacyl-ACP dehydratase
VLQRQDILELVPHAGEMCLIDSVRRWDEYEIHCMAENHRAPAHPLRHWDSLSSLHLIEYGAQAMAVHGALLNRGHRTAPGMLVSIRDCKIRVARIDLLAGALEVHAYRRLAQINALMYDFRVLHDGEDLANGRLTVMFET